MKGATSEAGSLCKGVIDVVISTKSVIMRAAFILTVSSSIQQHNARSCTNEMCSALELHAHVFVRSYI